MTKANKSPSTELLLGTAILTLSQLQTPQGVELVPLMQGDDRTVVTIHLPRTQSESQTGQTTAAGVPAAKTDK